MQQKTKYWLECLCFGSAWVYCECVCVWYLYINSNVNTADNNWKIYIFRYYGYNKWVFHWFLTICSVLLVFLLEHKLIHYHTRETGTVLNLIWNRRFVSRFISLLIHRMLCLFPQNIHRIYHRSYLLMYGISRNLPIIVMHIWWCFRRCIQAWLFVFTNLLLLLLCLLIFFII